MSDDQFRPGVLYCDHCRFRLVTTNLYMGSGTTGPGDTESRQVCPNDGKDMRRVTWKEDCLAAEKWASELWGQRRALQLQLDAINTPELLDFVKAVELEAKHQRLKWGAKGDSGKADLDWFWLIGYLAQKAISGPTPEKRLHHCVTTAAACLNWHAAKLGVYAPAPKPD